MHSLELLNRIQQTWLARVSRHFAQREPVRDSFLHELNRFYDLLQQFLSSGDVTSIDPILIEWSDSLTQSDLEESDAILSPLCDVIFSFAYDICHDLLSQPEALELISALLPVHTHAISFTNKLEKDREIDNIRLRMEKMRTELERLDKSKSDFISVAAHELKTPLTLIEGYAAMLREMISGSDRTDQIAMLLGGMEQGSRRLKRIIDDMIDVSLIDNNLLTLNFQPLWLDRLFSILREEFSTAVSERNQRFEINTFEGCNEMIFADPERLYQALQNLISNAVKYTPDGGYIKIDGRELPGFLEVIIEDTGIGIASEDQMRIFEKFNRIGDATLHSSGKIKFKGGGPGLGLPITKGIIEAHGGALWVESAGYDEEMFPGSTFHVLIPNRKEPPDDKFAKLFGPLIKTTEARGI